MRAKGSPTLLLWTSQFQSLQSRDCDLEYIKDELRPTSKASMAMMPSYRTKMRSVVLHGRSSKSHAGLETRQ